MWVLVEGNLGHVISGEGIAVDPTKVVTVTNWEAPTSVGETQSFLGLAWYYRRFIENFSKLQSPWRSCWRRTPNSNGLRNVRPVFRSWRNARLQPQCWFLRINARIIKCIITLLVEDLEQCWCRREELFHMPHNSLNPTSWIMLHTIWS